jgi:hypothetical protein
MKGVVFISVMIVAAGTSMAFAQGTSMYDRNYAGPMNVWGQPTFMMPPQQAPKQQAQPQPNQGLIFRAGDQLWQAGEYLWSYMPAPVRGVDSPYAVQPGSGQVITNFVPGSR